MVCLLDVRMFSFFYILDILFMLEVCFGVGLNPLLPKKFLLYL